MVGASAEGAASELKPKTKEKKMVYLLEDAGDSPGKILAVCSSWKRAEKAREEPGMPRYTKISKHKLLE